MELAIVLGLGALGWRLAAKGAAPRDLQYTPPTLGDQNQYPFDTQLDTRILLDADTRAAQAHFTRVYDPVTGTYTFPAGAPDNGQWGPTRPMLTSDKTFHGDAQRRVELFTGLEDTWRHKAEQAPVFAPAEKRVAVGSGGAAKSAEDLYDRSELVDRNVFGSQLNNMLPFEQSRVGPGLGVGADVPSADGLHSQFRVMPADQINAHRINQLPAIAPSGGTLSGIGQKTRRPARMQVNKPSLVEHAPQLANPFGAVTAPAWLPEPEVKPTRADGTSRCYQGPVRMVSEATTVRSQEGHVQRADKALAMLPCGGGRSQVAAPMETETTHERYTGRRDAAGPGVTGASAATAFAPQADGGCYVMKPTFREASGCVVPGAATVGAGDMRPAEPSASGFRESAACNAGAAAWLKRDAVRETCFRMGKGHEAQGRTQHGSSAVAQACAGRVQRKVQANAFGKPPAGAAPSAQQRTDYYGPREKKKKLPCANPRTKGLGLGLFGSGPYGFCQPAQGT